MIEESGAVLFVSHSASQIRQACNRIIVLDNHQILFDGDVEKGLEIYKKFEQANG